MEKGARFRKSFLEKIETAFDILFRTIRKRFR